MTTDHNDDNTPRGPSPTQAREGGASTGKRLPPDVAAALAKHSVEEVLAMVLMRQRDLEEAVRHLRTLVPEAFKEGFAKRDMTTQEPWLADWVTSETKQALEALFERRA